MCLKQKSIVQQDSILQKTRELQKILEEGKQEEKFLQYEIVRQQGYYNMLDDRARILTGLTEKEYNYILKHYTELILKFPKVKDKAKSKLQYLKSAQISKIIAIKGCSNCIEIVSKKLDVTENDLCENCKKFITDQQIM